MNRGGLGLAVGAGYLLGRTKKLKLAVAVGTMVAGKKMNLTPKGIAEPASPPSCRTTRSSREIGDQLRTDLRAWAGRPRAPWSSGRSTRSPTGCTVAPPRVRDQLSGVADPRRPASVRLSDSSDPSESAEDRDDSRLRGSRRTRRSARSTTTTATRTSRRTGSPTTSRREEPERRREARRERAAKKAPPEPRKAARKAPAPAKKGAAKAPAK
ncbi:DNA primase [Streptomyces thinghirensis]|nr:DNA primase [Streptomyces thinghirensis]